MPCSGNLISIYLQKPPCKEHPLQIKYLHVLSYLILRTNLQSTIITSIMQQGKPDDVAKGILSIFDFDTDFSAFALPVRLRGQITIQSSRGESEGALNTSSE